MKKNICVFIISFLMLALLSGCQSGKNEVNTVNINDNVKMEGMEHLYAFNKYGYYFDIYSELSKDEERNGTIQMKKSTDTLYVEIENAGIKRNMAIQIFIDYVQVPILVDGKEYVTYTVNADENFSEKFSFTLKNEIDEKVNHKMTAIMTDCDGAVDGMAGETYSLAYDMMLEFAENNMLITNQLYDCEEPEMLYEDMFQGLLINDDLKEAKRTVPEKIVNARPGEKIKLSYHVGGYEDCQEVLIIVSLGMEQTEVNEQNYIRCKVADKKIFNSILEVTAPGEVGQYTLTAWVIKDPFSECMPEFLPLDEATGFTINVCE